MSVDLDNTRNSLLINSSLLNKESLLITQGNSAITIVSAAPRIDSLDSMGERNVEEQTNCFIRFFQSIGHFFCTIFETIGKFFTMIFSSKEVVQEQDKRNEGADILIINDGEVDTPSQTPTPTVPPADDNGILVVNNIDMEFDPVFDFADDFFEMTFKKVKSHNFTQEKSPDVTTIVDQTTSITTDDKNKGVECHIITNNENQDLPIIGETPVECHNITNNEIVEKDPVFNFPTTFGTQIAKVDNGLTTPINFTQLKADPFFKELFSRMYCPKAVFRLFSLKSLTVIGTPKQPQNSLDGRVAVASSIRSTHNLINPQMQKHLTMPIKGTLSIGGERAAVVGELAFSTMLQGDFLAYLIHAKGFIETRGIKQPIDIKTIVTPEALKRELEQTGYGKLLENGSSIECGETTQLPVSNNVPALSYTSDIPVIGTTGVDREFTGTPPQELSAEPSGEYSPPQYQEETEISEDVIKSWTIWAKTEEASNPYPKKPSGAFSLKESTDSILSNSLDRSWTALEDSDQAERINKVQLVKDGIDYIQVMYDENLVIQSIQHGVEYQGPELIHAYLNTAEQLKGLNNDTVIGFVNGKIVALDKNDRLAAKQQRVFLQLMNKTYGIHLTTTVAARYQYMQLKVLTWGQVKFFLAGIGANLKEFHLRNLFLQIKGQSEISDNPMSCVNYLDPEELSEIKLAQSFEDLSHSQIKSLVDLFRTVPVDNKRVPIVKALFDGKPPKNTEKGHNPQVHDVAMLNSFEMVAILNANEPHLSNSEHISKEYSYCELKQGMILPLLGTDGELCYFKVDATLEYKGDAILSEVIVPLVPQQNTINEPVPFYLAFRGTQFTYADRDSGTSIANDVDPWGVANTAFSRRKAEILKLVSETFKANPWAQHINYIICGHSHGGAVTQRAFGAYVEQLAQQSKLFFQAQEIIHKLSPDFKDAEHNLEILLKNSQTQSDRVRALASLETVFEKNGSFDRLKQLYNDAKSQRAVDAELLVQLTNSINAGNKFKNILDRFKSVFQRILSETSPVFKKSNALFAELGLISQDLAKLSGEIRTHYLPAKERLVEIMKNAKAFFRIAEITSCHWNSPTVEVSFNETFKRNIQELESSRPDIRAHIDCGKFEGDIVQDLAGGVIIGHNVQSKILSRRIIHHFPTNKKLTELELHGAKAYTGSFDGTRQIIDETNPQVLDKILGLNWHWDPNTKGFFNKTGKLVAWYAGYIPSTALLVPQSMLYAGVVLTTKLYGEDRSGKDHPSNV